MNCPKLCGHFTYHSFFASDSNRKAISGGTAEFTACHFYEIPKWFCLGSNRNTRFYRHPVARLVRPTGCFFFSVIFRENAETFFVDKFVFGML